MANHRSLSEVQERKVVVLYTEERMSVASIARRFGVHYETAKSVLRRHGVALKPRGQGQLRKSSESRVREAVALYEGGENCDDVAAKFGVTRSAVLRWVRAAGGVVRPAGFQKGGAHPGWAGGRLVKDGYAFVLVSEDDPLYCMAQSKVGKVRYALEHRIVMARHLGRPLTRSETVHHIDDKDKLNNDISNLQLRQGKHGKGAVHRCVDCGSYNIEAVALATH
jgi:transposase